MKITITSLALAFVFMAAAAPNARSAPIADAGPVRLYDSVIVTGTRIHLGDLFAGAGDKAAATIAYAPDPGKRATFDARWLYRVARAYGLKWRPLSLKDQVVVERESQVIGRGQIEGRILDALVEKGVDPDMQIELGNRLLRLYVGGDVTPTLGVTDLAYNPRTRRFSATLIAPEGDPTAKRVRVTGRLHKVLDVPVLTRRLMTGDIITKKDIRWIKVRASRTQSNIILDSANLVGMSVKRGQRAGRPLRSVDVGRPVMVPKGSYVTLVLKTPVMLITAKGRALEDGGMGDTIRVTNSQSNTVVEGMVTGANRVVISLTDRVVQN